MKTLKEKRSYGLDNIPVKKSPQRCTQDFGETISQIIKQDL